MPPRRRRLSAIKVLDALATGAGYGFDVMDWTGLPSGTVYPILSRLERDGLVVSRWEDAERAQAEKRPPRRYYELTAWGVEALESGLERYCDLARRRNRTVAPETP